MEPYGGVMRVLARFVIVGIAVFASVWGSVTLLNGADLPVTPSWETGLSPAVQATSPLSVSAECRMKDLPAAFEYDAVGVYEGAKIAAPSDARFAGHDLVGGITVKVTATGRPVVLLLSSFRPAVWTIEAASGVEIAGIVSVGQGPAMVKGDVPQGIQVIDATGGQCGLHGPIYAIDGDDFRGLQNVAIAIAGAKLSTFQGVYNESKFIVGPGATHISQLAEIRKNQRIEKYLPGTYEPSFAKVQTLIDQGAVRPASDDEFLAWASQDPELRAYGLVRKPQMPGAVYMILKPFAYPEGMSGAARVNFILPEGMPMPTGNPGHNSILKMDISDGCIELKLGRICVPLDRNQGR